MAEAHFSPLADADLFEIWDFLATDSLAAADRFVEELSQRANLLAATPLIGRARPELGSQIRSFPVGNYAIYYRPTEGGIEVARVLSSFRDLEAILGDEGL